MLRATGIANHEAVFLMYVDPWIFLQQDLDHVSLTSLQRIHLIQWAVTLHTHRGTVTVSQIIIAIMSKSKSLKKREFAKLCQLCLVVCIQYRTSHSHCTQKHAHKQQRQCSAIVSVAIKRRS